MTVDPVALIRFFETRAPIFAIPRYIEIIAELPKTPSEKIQKHLLRSAGIGADTWDRKAAGILVEHETRRIRRQPERSPP